MSKVCIHIGLHKTATTFLQTTVFPKLKDTVYLSRPYTQLNHAFNKLQYADDTRFEVDEVLREIKQFQGAGKILISDEMLSGVPNFNYINRSTIAYRLKEVFPDARIILFLRGQLDLILSLHNTWIKNLNGTREIDSCIFFPSKNYHYQDFDLEKLTPGRSFSFDSSDYYYFCHDRFTLNLSNFLYYELVTLYKSLFENVHIFLFEDFRHSPSIIIEELKDILGDDFHDLNIEKLSSSSNVSLKESALEGRRFRNSLQEITNNKLALKIAEWSGMIKYSLSNKKSNHDYIIERVNGFYAENNQKLVDQYPDIKIEKYPKKYQI